MKSLIEQTVRWAAIGKHPKDEYRYAIGRAVLDKETAVLRVGMTLNFIIPLEDAEAIEREVAERFGIPGAKLDFTYEDLILTEEEIIRHALPYFIREANGTFRHLTRSIDTARFRTDGETVTVSVIGKKAENALNEDVAALFSAWLNRDFALDRTFRFVNAEDAYEAVKNDAKKAEEDALADITSRIADARQNPNARTDGGQPNGKTAGPAGGAEPKTDPAPNAGTAHANADNPFAGHGRPRQRRVKWNEFVPAKGNALMGKLLKKPTHDVKSLAEDSGAVVLKGEVIRMDGRVTKNGNVIVQLVIADRTGAMGLKFFAIPKKWEELEGLLAVGDTVLAGGTVEYDPYEKALAVRTTDITKSEKEYRKDTAKEKRVELHLHTTMSAMDGMNDIESVLKLAAKWGHKAMAVTDHGVVMAFPDAMRKAPKDFKVIYGMEGYLLPDDNGETFDTKLSHRGRKTYHIILLAKDQTGLRNLYELVSESNLKHFYRRPLILRSTLEKHREGLIVGSACEMGELYQAIENGLGEDVIERTARFYDYLEIQPIVNNAFLVRDGVYGSEEDLRNNNRMIVALGEKLGIPVCATTDSHYTEPEDALYRRIIQTGNGFKDAESGEGLYFRTTDEMLAEFAYLGKEKAYEVVVANTNRIADMVGEVRPIAKGNFPPTIAHSEERLRELCYTKAHELYGDPLPELIETRLAAELDYVISKGYAVLYIAAQMLVEKSNRDGFLVGSRGSVGSSFAATMAGITEVNPLPPHYRCPNKACKHIEFDFSGTYDCGVDMPEKNCPVCGERMAREGFNIPFETFLGIAGADKEPDIDLNFAGEYQPEAHKYVGVMFGAENCFRAGTISGVEERTAYGYVLKYFEEKGEVPSKWDVDYLASKCTGVRRSNGQHPGGIVICPEGHDINEFTPVMHPPTDDETVTTHFDYHAIDKNLLKLDILGHKNPSIIRHLQDMTGRDPMTVEVDPKVMSIFLGPEALDIKIPDYRFTHGTFGVPEFGTGYVRGMLDDIQPKHFQDLVRIAGFSHGTDVWLGNAQELIRAKTATIDEVIGSRDDIMQYLMAKGQPGPEAFKIMEKVRKGKGVTDDEAARMKEFDVPDWYIESCRKIKYMFPKAHSVAYTLMSYRIAYYKVYYPQAFYAATFSGRLATFNMPVILGGIGSVLARMDELNGKGNGATALEKEEVITLELAYEMYARGYEFLPVSLDSSAATKFNVEDGKVRLSLQAIAGLGETAAKSIEDARKDGPFRSVEDLQNRTKGLSSTLIDALRACGALGGIPDTDQLSLF